MNIPTPSTNDSWSALDADVIACRACPRLVEWREQVAREKRRAFRDYDYWGKPVPGFGDQDGRLLLVGLAPGAHGSNRTGRPFTGDSSGDTLFAALHRAGFANQATGLSLDDGLVLTDAFITAVGRCAPPKNKPTREELNNCRPFFEREWHLMPQLRVVMALGQIAYDGSARLMRDMGYDVPKVKFGHGVQVEVERPPQPPKGGSLVPPAGGLGGPIHLLASYHPSRQNTQTGRLTPEMMDDVFALARELMDDA